MKKKSKITLKLGVFICQKQSCYFDQDILDLSLLVNEAFCLNFAAPWSFCKTQTVITLTL